MDGWTDSETDRRTIHVIMFSGYLFKGLKIHWSGGMEIYELGLLQVLIVSRLFG